MDFETLIIDYKRTCETILKLELELISQPRKDERKQAVMRSANDYKDALWELITHIKSDPYND